MKKENKEKVNEKELKDVNGGYFVFYDKPKTAGSTIEDSLPENPEDLPTDRR